MSSRRDMLMTTQEKLAAGLTGERVKVSFRSRRPKVNVIERHIKLPPVPEDVTHETEVMVRSWTTHETSHLVFGSRPWELEVMTDRVLKELAFSLEDCRCDRMNGEMRPGTLGIRRAGFNATRPRLKVTNVLQAAYYVLYEQVKNYYSLEESITYWTEQVGDERVTLALAQLMRAVEEQVERARRTRTQEEVVELSKDIKGIWKQIFMQGKEAGEEEADEDEKLSDGGQFGEKDEAKEPEERPVPEEMGEADEEDDVDPMDDFEEIPSEEPDEETDKDEDEEIPEPENGDTTEPEGDLNEPTESEESSDADEDADSEEESKEPEDEESEEPKEPEDEESKESQGEEAEDAEPGELDEEPDEGVDQSSDGEGEGDAEERAEDPPPTDEDAPKESEDPVEPEEPEEPEEDPESEPLEGGESSGDDDDGLDDDGSEEEVEGRTDEEAEEDMDDLMDDFKSVSDAETDELEGELSYDEDDEDDDMQPGYIAFTENDEVIKLRPQEKGIVYTRQWGHVPASNIPYGLQGRGKPITLAGFKAGIKAKAAKLQRRLLMDLMSRRRLWVRDRERGQIDDTRLARVPTGDKRIAKRKLRRPALDIAITILLDMSYSMVGNVMFLCGQLCYALAETLTILRVPFEILGFTTGGGIGDEDPPDDLCFHRIDPLQLIIIKDFLMNRRRDILGLCYAAAAYSGGGTIEGEAIMWAARRLHRRRESRKLLAVLCDGGPCGNGAPNEKYEEHAAFAVRKCREAGIETMHAGIMTDDPLKYVPENTFVRYDGLDDLLGNFYSRMGAILRGERRNSMSTAKKS